MNTNKALKEVREVNDSFTLAVREHPALRDYFAGLAMQGMLAGSSGQDGEILYLNIAKISYSVADAMIVTRKRGFE